MSLFFAPSRKLAAKRLEHGGHRIYDPRERIALAGFDAALRIASPLLGLRPSTATTVPSEAKRILALRLDRLGDLLTTLPALQSLKRAAPDAQLELAVGSWNEPIAKRLPFIDSVRVVDTPWAAWGKNVRFRDARNALVGEEPDLALEFQGDVRVLVLMARTRARLRAGYAETGGSYLLTHRARWDEARSWYWQNLQIVKSVFPDAPELYEPYNFVTVEDREKARALVKTSPRKRVGIHPSAGRSLKEWGAEKFAALADALAESVDVVVTGSAGDREVVEAVAARAKARTETLIGTDLLTFAAVVESLDVFVTGDSGPMHLSHAVGTKNVAIFGPSDPARYGPENLPSLRRVVREPVYCSPCNMIRRPPDECAAAAAPECIAGIPVDRVLRAVRAAL